MADIPHLLYGATEDEALVFVPVAMATELLTIHQCAPTWKTWGDARRDLSPPRYADLLDLHWVGPAPDIETPLELESLLRDGPWPLLSHRQMADWLPAAVLEDHGEIYDTMLSSGVNLPVDREDEILMALEERGVRCTSDPRVAELFSDWE
jgi:hypothetical protein